jgi:hypothetical protein
MSEGTLVLNHGATNVAPTQKDKPLSLQRGGPISKHITGLETNRILVIGPYGGAKPRITEKMNCKAC